MLHYIDRKKHRKTILVDRVQSKSKLPSFKIVTSILHLLRSAPGYPELFIRVHPVNLDFQRRVHIYE